IELSAVPELQPRRHLGHRGALQPLARSAGSRGGLRKCRRRAEIHSGSALGFGARPQAQMAVGGFYTHEISNKEEVVNFYDATGAPLTTFDPFQAASLPSSYKEYAAFGDLTYSVSPQFDIGGGLRFAHNSQAFVQRTNLGVLGGGPQPDLSGQSGESVTT